MWPNRKQKKMFLCSFFCALWYTWEKLIHKKFRKVFYINDLRGQGICNPLMLNDLENQKPPLMLSEG